MSDQSSVIQAVDKRNRGDARLLSFDGESDSWNLKLTALSADDPERLVRYLTGALLACGGWILARSIQGTEGAELDFEFARATCVEIYSILVATGLELSRNSHLQLAELCHCTRNLIASHAFDIVRVDLVIYHATSKAGLEEYTPAMAG